MNKSWMWVALGALLMADNLVMPARAQNNVVYAAEYNHPTNYFGTINLLNGSFTTIASIGKALINDIAYCPTNGVLYGISNSTDPGDIQQNQRCHHQGCHFERERH